MSELVQNEIRSIIEKTMDDQPFYVANFSDVVCNYQYWRNKLPSVEVFYAVKSNPDPMLLRLMVALGIGFDTASEGEIETVLSAGALASDIIYSHPFKSISSLRYAESLQVDLMTFDSEQELLKIKRIFPQARLILRIQIPDVQAVFALGNKFGCKMKQTEDLLLLGKTLGLNIAGISFHVGSLCLQTSAYAKAILMARQAFDIAEGLGMHLTLLDIGGGFPGARGTENIFDEICCFINQGLEEHFPEGCGVRIIAEPGCYMVCSSYTLCTKILGKRMEEIEDENLDNYGKKKCSYYLNDGVFGSFAYGFMKYHWPNEFAAKPVLSKSQLACRPLIRSKIWGRTCSSFDCIFDGCTFPEMEIGEHIVFENMGAYTFCLTSNFNGFSAPCIHYIFPKKDLFVKALSPSLADLSSELTCSQQNALIEIQNSICNGDAKYDSLRNATEQS